MTRIGDLLRVVSVDVDLRPVVTTYRRFSDCSVVLAVRHVGRYPEQEPKQ